MTPRLIIVADDLTGAADTAGAFAAGGLSTHVYFNGEMPAAEVVAMSTETRDVSPATAAATVSSAARAISASAGAANTVWFKKIDSALRGNILAEVEALSLTTGLVRIVVAPAVPSQGRTTVDGKQQLAAGVSEHLRLAADLADLRRLFQANSTRLPVRMLSRSAQRQGGSVTQVLAVPGIVIADAETDQDLDRLVSNAGVIDPNVLLVGAAGLGAAVARRLGIQTPPSELRESQHPPGPALVVAGSRHAATAKQVAHLESTGAVLIRPAANVFNKAEASLAVWVELARDGLAAGRTAVITCIGVPGITASSDRVAEVLASIALKSSLAVPTTGYVLTGGDTARAFASLSAIASIALAGEVEPAVPYGRFVGGLVDGRPVATKAGSFGDVETLSRAAATVSGT